MTGKPQNNNTRQVLSIESLAVSYQRPLLRYFLRQGLSIGDAKDCVQEVFARVVKKGDVGGLENPQGYIFKIANNLLKDRSRRRITAQTDKHQDINDALLFCERPSQDRILAGRQELELVKKAILKMPPKVQRVFVLNRFEGLKYREIAGVLGMSISAVEKHMMTALKRLNTLRDSL
jgi:RNA polymerase sigma-70 factor (ECF subfamily)